ncbi:U-box domain-containing protein/KAP domain-containing protein [Cephalotus follicularis]|uniref:RING-type E3 ubiquitin transferase n=1 Tax=Cephalotus follicularis TaxID=3775 RepID=A0A1Q3BSV8_CEPFO|nr:U-box domain-containing protein/KAP domain-containing protein [Cephalotus follicularis]
MGGNGKHRWKLTFYHRSSSAKQPPKEFLCPISGSLMSDPVVVPSGHTFERVSVNVCRDLNYVPLLDDGSKPDFSTLIPNLNMRSTIINWCDDSGTPHPPVPDYYSVEKTVREMMVSSGQSRSGIRDSERDLLKGVEENPPVIFSHATSELTHRVNHFYSSSSEESVIVSAAAAATTTSASPTSSPHTPLPLATRPACYSSTTTSSSSSSEMTEILTLDNNNSNNSDMSSCPEEEALVSKLRSSEIHEQEEAVISLRRLTRTKEETRSSLCTTRLLSVLRSLIASRYGVVQTNAAASLVNLSLEKSNKVKIVRSGFVPLLIDVLKSGSSESQEHAAGALFSLALEDENKMAIGVLGALQPLMHALRSESEQTRHDSALALYHLSLTQSNRVKLVKLGAVPSLLSMLRSGESASRILLILCNLAACTEGKSAMLDANAVGILVGILRENESDSETTRENCVAALFALSHGSWRFRGLAKEARAMEVLREIEERGSERAREKAKRILQMMRGREETDGDVLRGVEVLESGGLSCSRYRVGSVHGPNSTNF